MIEKENIFYSCDLCGATVDMVHVIVAEDGMGILSVAGMCDECADKVSFEYNYLLSLSSCELEEQEKDKYGLFS